jgi:hypothetical protein
MRRQRRQAHSPAKEGHDWLVAGQKTKAMRKKK